MRLRARQGPVEIRHGLDGHLAVQAEFLGKAEAVGVAAAALRHVVYPLLVRDDGFRGLPVVQEAEFLEQRPAFERGVPQAPGHDVVAQVAELARVAVAVRLHERAVHVVAQEEANVRRDGAQVREGQVIGGEVGVVVPDPDVVADGAPASEVVDERAVFFDPRVV